MEPRIKILFGSETGNAQDFAEQIWQIYRSKNIRAECFAFDDYPIRLLNKEKIVIFIVSTSGQGEMPTNMRKNWSYLLSKNLLEKTCLSNTSFALLGLGDSSYQKFNYAAKKLYRRLIQLGAMPILELSLADEQHHLGIDEIFDKWRCELLEKNLQLENRIEGLSSYQSKFFIHFKTDLQEASKFFPSTLLENIRLTADDHFQETRLISFSLDRHNLLLKYTPGDILMILPENLQQTIDIAKNCLKSCQQYLNTPMSICPLDPFIPKSPQFWRLIHLDAPTLLDCFNFYFDFQCVPRRSFIQQVAARSIDKMEKERLIELSSSDSIDDYLDYCVHSKRTTAEFLRDFPQTSAILTPFDLFNFFPIIRPRAFSMASSPSAQPDKIQILVARVQYHTRNMKNPRLGLCSNFLCSLTHGRKVYIRVRPGIFHYDGKEPLILVGPGTGIAPFRSMIAENEFSSPGFQAILFFGCRSEFRDFYFKNEWLNCAKSIIITAFSRDQDKKVYVQHKIIENGKQIWELISKGAKILIAGSAGEMPKQVISAFKQVMVEFGQITSEGADKYIEMMEKRRKIQCETWS